MAMPENEAGKAYLANVTVTEAVAFDPETDDPDKPETWNVLSAGDYEAEHHGNMQFFCPCCLDKGDQVRLKRPSTDDNGRAREYFQTIQMDVVDSQTEEPIIDPATNEPMVEHVRYKIPPRFTLWPGHRHTCDLASQQRNLSETLYENGGVNLNSSEGTYIVNMNIAAGQRTAKKKRPRIGLTESGEFDSLARGTKRKLHRSSSTPPGKHSEGVKDISTVAKMLDNTEFEQGARDRILMRVGTQLTSLGEMYKGSAFELYRDIYRAEHQIANDPNANHNHAALFRFRPNGNRKFWKKEQDGSMTVPSHPEKTHDRQGREFYFTSSINFQTDGAFEQFKKAYDEAESPEDRWFLVYTEHANVDIFDHQHKAAGIDEERGANGGTQKSTPSINVETTVFSKDQMMQWSPPSAQLMLDFSKPPSHDVQDGPASLS